MQTDYGRHSVGLPVHKSKNFNSRAADVCLPSGAGIAGITAAVRTVLET
jgi:hypothetical protein